MSKSRTEDLIERDILKLDDNCTNKLKKVLNFVPLFTL